MMANFSIGMSTLIRIPSGTLACEEFVIPRRRESRLASYNSFWIPASAEMTGYGFSCFFEPTWLI